MKKSVKFSAAIMTLALCIMFSACGAKKAETTNINESVFANSSVDATGQKGEKVYQYQATGMQNVASVESNGVYPYSTNSSMEKNSVLISVRCPQCNAIIRTEAYLDPEHIGDASYIYTGQKCCMNDHADKFQSKWFDYSVMFTKVD